MTRFTPLAQPATVVSALCLLAVGVRALPVTAQIIEVPPFEVVSVPDVAGSEVSVATDGTMLISWQRNVNGFAEMYVRHYTEDGVALGPVTRLDTQASVSLAIASDLQGGYVASWMHLSGGLTNNLFRFALDATGAVVGSEYQVNQYGSRPANGTLTGLPSGSVVVWMHSGAFAVQEVMARIFNASGLPIGDQFRIGAGGVDTRAVAARRDGGFQVAWDNWSDGAPRFRIYDAAGNPRTSPGGFDTLVSGVRRTAASPIDDTAVVAGYENYLWLARVSGLATFNDRLTFVKALAPHSVDVAYASDGTMMLAWVDRGAEPDTWVVRGGVYDSELQAENETFDLMSTNYAQTVRIARRSDGGSMAATWTTPGKVYGAVVKLCAPLNGFCGNGTLETPCGEVCDDGAGNDDGAPNACRTDCRPAHCGDGVMDDGEECDDGNNANCDGCSALCTNEVGLGCGDGIAFPSCGESCDDANTIAGDGCSATCTAERALGGGSPVVDCFAEWSIDNTANDPRLDDRGFISGKQRCVDDDPRCDFDGGVPGSCTFHVAVCANNTNSRDCQPASRLASWELVRPSAAQAAHNPAYARDRAAFQSVPGVIVGPQIRNICTDFVAVEVPVRGKAGKLKLKSVARSYDAGSDTDSLALTCLASAL